MLKNKSEKRNIFKIFVLSFFFIKIIKFRQFLKIINLNNDAKGIAVFIFSKFYYNKF